jgi:hypothetical protein
MTKIRVREIVDDLGSGLHSDGVAVEICGEWFYSDLTEAKAAQRLIRRVKRLLAQIERQAR